MYITALGIVKDYDFTSSEGIKILKTNIKENVKAIRRVAMADKKSFTHINQIMQKIYQ